MFTEFARPDYLVVAWLHFIACYILSSTDHDRYVLICNHASFVGRYNIASLYTVCFFSVILYVWNSRSQTNFVLMTFWHYHSTKDMGWKGDTTHETYWTRRYARSFVVCDCDRFSVRNTDLLKIDFNCGKFIWVCFSVQPEISLAPLQCHRE